MRRRDGRFRKVKETYNSAGEAHELTFSCYRGLSLLGRDRTRKWLINAIDAARTAHDLELWAYVIMPDHAHMLFLPQCDAYDISAVNKSIKQSVARRALRWLRLNDPAFLERLRGERAGSRVRYHFWQPGSGYDRNIIEPKTAWSSVQYFHDNPVRVGLVERATDWVWSSARWYAGLDSVMLEMDGRPPDSI